MSFSCEDQDDETLAFLELTSIEVRAPIRLATMPLFYAAGDSPRLLASSVLLRISKQHFILTAAHVFDDRSMMPIPINVTDGVPGHRLIPAGEVTLHRSPTEFPTDRLKDDPYDVCVCEITEVTANQILAGGQFRFLTLSEIEPWEPELLQSWYMVFGFPGQLNAPLTGSNTLTSNSCAFASFIYGGERGNIPSTNSDKGVGIFLDYGTHSTRDDAGRSVLPPAPYGMSGGGIWRIASSGIEMTTWSIAALKLIGIQSGVYPDHQVLRGTRIEHAIGIVYRACPALRTEIDEHFGRDSCRRHFLT